MKNLYLTLLAVLIAIVTNGQTISGTLTVCEGATRTLTGVPTGSSWSVSDSTVATVSSLGVVTGIAAGTTYISYGGTVAVMTVNPNPAPITGATLTVCVGETDTLLAFTPDGIWMSSTPGIATIDSITGVIHSFSAGVFTITYTAPNTCFVTRSFTVNASPAAITGPNIICLGQTGTQTCTTTGGSWTSSTPAMLTISATTGIAYAVGTGPVTITYTLPAGCYVTKPVTVAPLPAAITGTASVCDGTCVTLSDATPGGTWSSSVLSVAMISSSTGIACGISAGTTMITYTSVIGCATTMVLTVLPIPGPIFGTLQVCPGLTTSLTNATPGGTWSSSNTAVATINPTTGTATGITSGTTIISYTAGCTTTVTLTVSTLPDTTTWPATVCVGSSSTLSSTSAGGTWSSSNDSILTFSPTFAALAPGVITITYTLPTGCIATKFITVNASPAAITGAAITCTGHPTSLSCTTVGGTWSSSTPTVATIGSGTGVAMGIGSGTTNISYTITATGCSSMMIMSVTIGPAAITGPGTICAGTSGIMTCGPSGGVWSSSNSSIATIGSATGIVNGLVNGAVTITYALSTGCMTTRAFTVNPTPAPITGPSSMCDDGSSVTMSCTTSGGTWSSSFVGTAIIDAGGTVTALTGGVITISYTLSSSCAATKLFTVNSPPMPITGTPMACVSSSTALSSTTTGGTWTSSNTSIATIGSSTGIVTGVSAGTTNITYMVSTGCFTVQTFTVNPLPALITGPSSICDGNTATMSSTTTGGTWSSSDASIASIDATMGVVTGNDPGVVTITYMMPTGCLATKSLTVNTTPAAITGAISVCEGATATISCTTTGGVWTSSNTAVASVGLTTGIVNGLSNGVVTTSYTLGSCYSTRAFTVNTTPAAITGTAAMCDGSTITLSSIPLGGTWSSSDVTIVGMGAGPGVFHGIVAGTATVSYQLGGCYATRLVTVNSVPGAITGDLAICLYETSTLSCTMTGGTWTSGAIAVATIGSTTGLVSPVTAGTANITYTLPTGCMTYTTFTVNPTPGAITGSAGICVGATSTLSSITPGGTWSTSTGTISVGTITGVISATAPGSATITYTAGTCYTTTVATATATPTVSVSSSLPACGPLYTSVATGATTYSWTPSTGITYGATMDTAFIYPTASTTTYTATGTTAGCSGTTSFTLSGNRILGHLSFGGAAPSGTDARVWLIQYNPVDSSIMAQDSLLTCLDNGNPYYEFDGKPAGDYLVKAKLTSSVAGTSDYMPTYGGSAATWDVATPITHTTGSDSLHIAMIYGTVPSGPGFISGYVYMGAGKGTATDVPVEHMIIYLKNTSGQVLAYTYTDASGAYMFSAIAAGNYVIWPEEMSYYTISYPISVSAGIPADNIGFKKLTSTGVIVPWSLPTAITTSQEERLSVYPNPATDVITVENAKGTSVTIYDMVGQKVMSTTVISNRLDIDIRQLASGIYVVEARGERFKIIKAER